MLNNRGEPILSNLISPTGNGSHRSAERGTRTLIKSLKENAKKVRDRSTNSNDGKGQYRTQGDEIKQGY